MIRITAGEKTPERTEEQREAADQLLSLSQPSERMDSLDEAGVGKRSAEFVGLVLSSDSDALLAKKPELTSTRPEVP